MCHNEGMKTLLTKIALIALTAACTPADFMPPQTEMAKSTQPHDEVSKIEDETPIEFEAPGLRPAQFCVPKYIRHFPIPSEPTLGKLYDMQKECNPEIYEYFHNKRPMWMCQILDMGARQIFKPGTATGEMINRHLVPVRKFLTETLGYIEGTDIEIKYEFDTAYGHRIQVLMLDEYYKRGRSIHITGDCTASDLNYEITYTN